jgi:hypothetical protein
MKILFTIVAKQATLMRRSTVLNLRLQSVFPALANVINILERELRILFWAGVLDFGKQKHPSIIFEGNLPK